jgi:GNAT superfamily N-acetyltransferase
MKVRVRKATASDCKEVLSLLKELRISGYKEMGVRDIKVKCSANASDFFQETIKRSDVLCLLAESEGKICGLCLAYLTPKVLDGNYRVVIEDLVVKEDLRGKGIGTALLKGLEQEAKKRGVTLIKITTGTKLKANKFYKKHGFTYFENAYRKKL